MTSGINDILATSEKILRTGLTLSRVPANGKVLAQGLEASDIAIQHPKEVPVTPLAKNGLKWAGDLDKDERLLAGAPITKFEKWVTEACEQFIRLKGGKLVDTYNSSLPLTDPSHYWVDCVQNLNINKWRDVGPGQIEEINKMITDKYVVPTKNLSLFTQIRTDANVRRAVELVASELPVCVASHEIREVNIPFMTKHTNVCFPWFKNDRTKVPHSNDTYATLTMKWAEAHKNDFEYVVKTMSYATEFARFQRLKGRLIIATSRQMNLVFNQLESQEIETYKVKCALFAGYNDDLHLRSVMEEMTKFAEDNNLAMYNLDYHRFDSTVAAEWKALCAGVTVSRCGGDRSKKLAFWRGVSGIKQNLLAGTLGKVVPIYGRILSGELDTNRGGGVINAMNMTSCLLILDPHYLRDIVNRCRYRMLVMGDDVLLICSKDTSIKSIGELAATRFGFEIDDPAKNAFGPKFLQYRLFKWGDKLVFIYPFPRVLRSMLFKERPGNLGEAGWTLAFYQQLAKLVDCPDILAFVVNIAAYLDDNKLWLSKPVSELIQMSNQEDEERRQKKGDRTVSTAERLNDGDPTKSRQFNSDGSINAGYFQELQDQYRAVYDPAFLSKFGIPQLNNH